jgi:hypothetical protein
MLTTAFQLIEINNPTGIELISAWSLVRFQAGPLSCELTFLLGITSLYFYSLTNLS